MNHPRAKFVGRSTDVSRPLDVDGPLLVETGPTDMYHRGGVDHSADTVRSSNNRLDIANITSNRLDVEPFQRSRVRRLAGQHTHRPTLLKQQADYVVADQPGGSGDKSDHRTSTQGNFQPNAAMTIRLTCR